jgi:phage tail sheath protein FI
MITSNIKSPGVYIQEINAFSNSVVAVATAVPAFIGYTPQALYQGKSYNNVPQKITSLADFEAIYCYPTAAAVKQYSPQYYLSPQKTKPTTGDYIQISDNYYTILPDPNTIYYLYNSIRLFYANGGGDAYIISVGGYGQPSGKAAAPGRQIVNNNVKLAELTAGLGLLNMEQEPTMYICPEATLLSVADNATLMQQMLLLSTQTQAAISIFDIIGGNTPDPVTYMNDIETFRNNTGTVGLNYGTAYYPFVGTTIVQPSELDYTNLFGGDVKQLAALLPEADATNVINNIQNVSLGTTTVQNNNALLAVSPTYALIMQNVLAAANLLPPSGGMAGVITTMDNEIGPWQAPANTPIVGVTSLPVKLSETQQGPLNVDAVSGKSVNAIRYFYGQGILVWGARTLDGNSLDWKYLQVRRTMIYIEQSVKLAARAYVFEPNNKNTWEAVKAMTGSFLADVWKAGGLMGATPADAFSVDCDLGTTMTGDDVLNGYMNITVKVAVIRPAEFIVLTFQQLMPTS